MFEGAVGVGVVILFLRMARIDDENPFLWAVLAAAAWFGPLYFVGHIASYVCAALLFVAYFAWRMLKPQKGGTLR